MSEDEFYELLEIKHGLSRKGWKEPEYEKVSFEELQKNVQAACKRKKYDLRKIKSILPR